MNNQPPDNLNPNPQAADFQSKPPASSPPPSPPPQSPPAKPQDSSLPTNNEADNDKEDEKDEEEKNTQGLTPGQIPRDDIGVGRPNIGVELDKEPEQPPSQPPAQSPSEPPVPPPPPAKPEEIPPPKAELKDKDEPKDEIEIISPPKPSFPPPSPPPPKAPAPPPSPSPSPSPSPPPPPPPPPPSPPKPPLAPTPEPDNIQFSRTDFSAKPPDKPVSPGIPAAQPAPEDKFSLKPSQPIPPIKAGSGPAGTLVAMTIVALIFGGAAGFFGFRYFDGLKTSADIATSPNPSTNSQDISLWPSYTSEKYNFTLKYPKGWFASTTEPQAETLVFAKNEASLKDTPTDFQINLVFQESNGQTLKTWLEANAASSAENQPAREITVDSQTAYQQSLKNNGPKVATYLDRGEKVMVVTYSAPEEIFGEGGDFYNQVINSIVLK